MLEKINRVFLVLLQDPISVICTVCIFRTNNINWIILLVLWYFYRFLITIDALCIKANENLYHFIAGYLNRDDVTFKELTFDGIDTMAQKTNIFHGDFFFNLASKNRNIRIFRVKKNNLGRISTTFKSYSIFNGDSYILINKDINYTSFSIDKFLLLHEIGHCSLGGVREWTGKSHGYFVVCTIILINTALIDSISLYHMLNIFLLEIIFVFRFYFRQHFSLKIHSENIANNFALNRMIGSEKDLADVFKFLMAMFANHVVDPKRSFIERHRINFTGKRTIESFRKIIKEKATLSEEYQKPAFVTALLSSTILFVVLNNIIEYNYTCYKWIFVYLSFFSLKACASSKQLHEYRELVEKILLQKLKEP